MTIVQWLLLPAFIHVGWVLLLLVRMGRVRMKAVRQGAVTIEEIALDNRRWPDDVRKYSNNYDNQFQLPVLFYAILPLLLMLVKVDWLQVALAWVFVLSRIVHSLVHTGGNEVMKRGQVFLVGYAALALMWAWFGLRLFVIG